MCWIENVTWNVLHILPEYSGIEVYNLWVLSIGEDSDRKLIGREYHFHY